jgi:hypothetical protein
MSGPHFDRHGIFSMMLISVHQSLTSGADSHILVSPARDMALSQTETPCCRRDGPTRNRQDIHRYLV